MNRMEQYWYHAAIERASYYRWCAVRGHLLPGGDPVTGQPHSQMQLNPGAVRAEAHRKAYIAMSRQWLLAARKMRMKK